MCRMGSTRLPDKALLKIKNKTVIEHVIDRAKMMRSADVVVLCTPRDEINDILETIGRSKGIQVFRGPENNVLGEFMGAVTKFNIDFFAVYTADDVFCDPQLMDEGIRQMIEGDYDFINIPENIICGGSAYCVSTKALQKVCQSKDTKNNSYFPTFFSKDDGLNIADLTVNNPAYKNKRIRMTLDYPEDLKFFERIFNEFDSEVNNFQTQEIVELIKSKPDIAQINYFRQKDFENNQAKDKHVRD